VAHAEAGGELLIASGNGPEAGQYLGLAARAGKWQWGIPTDACGHRLIDEFINRREPQGLQHALLLVGIRADVPSDEGILLLQFGETPWLGHGNYLIVAVCSCC